MCRQKPLCLSYSGLGGRQVTFTPGLEGLGERLLAKKRDAAAQKAETVWQAYLRRKRCARRPDAAAS